MSDQDDPKVEFEALSDDDLESVSGGATLTELGGTCTTNSGGSCLTAFGGACTTRSGGSCEELPREIAPGGGGQVA